MAKKEGKYFLLPHVSASVDVWTAKLYVKSDDLDGGFVLRESDDDNGMLASIEYLLNSAIEKSLAKLIEEELEDGIPINIPGQFLTIGKAEVLYWEDYIIAINLD